MTKGANFQIRELARGIILFGQQMQKIERDSLQSIRPEAASVLERLLSLSAELLRFVDHDTPRPRSPLEVLPQLDEALDEARLFGIHSPAPFNWIPGETDYFRSKTTDAMLALVNQD